MTAATSASPVTPRQASAFMASAPHPIGCFTALLRTSAGLLDETAGAAA